MGGLVAKGNNVNPVLGALQALMIEGIAHTPYANSLAGGAALAAAYVFAAADLVGLDQVVSDMFKTKPEMLQPEVATQPPAYTQHYYAGGRTG